MKKILMVVLVGLTCVGAFAAQNMVLDSLQTTYWNANRCWVLTYADLTDTNKATYGQALTNITIAAGQAVLPVAGVVVKSFVPTGTNANNSLTIIVGDTGNSTSQFLASQQLSGNGTPVLLKLGATDTAYTSADKMVANFVGVTNFAMNIFTQGEFRLYYKLIDQAKAK